MEIINAFVLNPVFRLLFCIGAGMLILGIIMHFGFNSVVALGYGVYDMMVIIFIFAISIGLFGVDSGTNDFVNNLFTSFYPNWLNPIVDMFDINKKAGLEIGKLLYHTGKLTILAMVIELLERLCGLMRKIWNGFWGWWLGESVITVFGVFLVNLIWTKLEQSTTQSHLQFIVSALFVIEVVIVLVLGLCSLFGSFFAIIDSEIYGFFLTTLVIAMLTFILAMIIGVTGIMSKIDSFVQNELYGSSAQALLIAASTLFLLWIIWYVLYRLLRDRIL